MATVQAASALITGTSVLLAAGAVTLRSFPITLEQVKKTKTTGILIGTTANSIFFSFGLSLIYMMIAEYPDAPFVSALDPFGILSLAVILLILFPILLLFTMVAAVFL